MRNVFKLAVMVVLPVLFSSTGLVADDQNLRLFENWQANVTANVNLRSGPSLGSDVVTRLNTNDPVLIRGIKGDWFQVIAETASSAHKGWVHGHYVRKAAVAEPVIDPLDRAPVVEQSPAAAAKASAAPRAEPAAAPDPAALSDTTPASTTVPFSPPSPMPATDPKASEPAAPHEPAAVLNAAGEPPETHIEEKAYEFAMDVPTADPPAQQADVRDIVRLGLRLAALVLGAGAFFISQRLVHSARAAAC